MRPDPPVAGRRPRLVVVELWGIGDLALAAPFLNAAARDHDVVLVAKPAASVLQPRFWPDVKVCPMTAPWTAFQGKYQLWRWPWAELRNVRNELRAWDAEVGVSARRDPRDHLFLRLIGVRRTLGFPRMGSQWLLGEPLALPPGPQHRYECWRRLAERLGFPLPSWRDRPRGQPGPAGCVLLHTGAARAVRVWPLERFRRLVVRLRQRPYPVRIACDPDQLDWWRAQGESEVVAAADLSVLVQELGRATVFIGNDSGPGHLAAVLGVPTFTIFGPQLPELFHPIHPDSEWIEGRPCPWKPCFDNCRFPSPHCLLELPEAEVNQRIEAFVGRRWTG